MTDKTKIEWTDATWNPIRGCSRVSPGCVSCYAEGVARRFSGPGKPYEGLINKHGSWNGNIRFVDHALTQPLRWKKPRRIFVNSMSDLFHENVTDEMIDKIFAVMALAPQHTFQILTKRPERMLRYFNSGDGEGGTRHGAIAGMLQDAPETWPERKGDLEWPLPNIWLGVSVENQEAADERIPLLLQTPAAIRFLSCEPLLGALYLERWMHNTGYSRQDENYKCPACGEIGWGKYFTVPSGGDDYLSACVACGADCEDIEPIGNIDWVIVGGESGPGARPMHPDWARSLRDQCQAADVPFFFKQWGEYWPNCMLNEDGSRDESTAWMDRIGKRKAGRALDGRTWDEYPA